MAVVWRLVALVAVLLMPLGMGAAHAAATSHHAAASSMPMQHCSDESKPDHPKGGLGECTMACAATLPAVAVAAEQLLPLVPAPAPRILAAPLPGLHPETATPPPRHS